METIKVPILPLHHHIVKVKENHEPDYKALCIFAAIGYFLGSDTHWKDLKALPPGTINKIDDEGYWIEGKPWFQWYYKPKNITFEQAVSDFTELFHQICKEQAGDQTILLPLSGGLDSRTQAVAYATLNNPIISYSYSFKNGYKEGGISKKIAKVLGYEYRDMTIQPGYLWEKIEELAKINGCYSDFTHPRQMGVIDEFRKMKGVFTLGHWGDVLFDKVAPEHLTNENAVDVVMNDILVRGGKELAEALWEAWELDGDFESYLRSRVQEIWDSIPIENHLGAKMRAYKSMTRAVRWTNSNFGIFEATSPIEAPYYDDRMCQFICEIPEEYLADRKIQIAYIKSQNPKVAKITWQAQKPFNLYNYHKNRTPYNLPYRVLNKAKRVTLEKIGKKYTQRNWELQFVGHENDLKLQERIFAPSFYDLVPKEIVTRFYNSFKNNNDVYFSHPVSMLLTLALWKEIHVDKNDIG